MEKILDNLYRMSSCIYGVLNCLGKFSEDLFYCMGKVCTSREEAEAIWNDGLVSIFEIKDCRSTEVDYEMKKFVEKKIRAEIIDFYNNRTSDDEFLLFLGFSINIYYIVGLYSISGKYDLSDIEGMIEDENVIRYANLLNEYIYSLIVKMIFDNISVIDFENVEKFQKLFDVSRGKEIDVNTLEKIINEADHNYIPDIRRLIYENDFEKNPEYILEEMISENSNYRFAWIYKCFEAGIRFYKTKGADISVYQYREKIGAELYYHILGIEGEELDGGKWEVKNGKIETIRPAVFSEFGIGIPKIKTVSSENISDSLPSLLEGKKRSKILNESIRQGTSAALRINAVVGTSANPFEYTRKLFEMLEEQKNELRDKNLALVKMQDERKNMIAHLAHSWGNECYPEIVKNVADELLKKGANSLANRLFKAYNSENNLMSEIIFLQAAMEESSDALQKIFKNGFVESGGGNVENKVYSVLEEGIEIYVFGLMNDNSGKEKRAICKRKLCKKMEILELMEDYVKRFEEEQRGKSSFLDWFSKKVFPVKISLDNVWKDINFGRTEFGKVVIKNIITELFTNVLFHGDDECKMDFYSDLTRMYIKVTNKIAKVDTKGSGNGLIAMRKLVSKLNFGTDIREDEGVVWKADLNDSFETVITLDKSLMYIEEW